MIVFRKKDLDICLICLLCQEKNVMNTVAGCFQFWKNWKNKWTLTSMMHFNGECLADVSELLLNVWIEQKQYNYQCVPVVNIEKSNLHKRIPAFLKAKFLNKKYSGSF